MRLQQPEPAAALLGLRAMKTIATAAGPLGPVQRTLLDTVRQVLLKLDVELDTLAPLEPAALAAGFPGAELRRQFVDGMLVVALADGVPAPATTAAVEAFAAALGVEGGELDALRRVTDQHLLMLRLDLLRRGHIADILRDQRDQHGLLGLAKGVLTMRGVIEEPALAARYQAWAELPDDTLGHAMVEYYRANGFSLPGERGGFPEAGAYHDFIHVLAGYGTDPAGEIEVAAFTAGFKQHRPFYIVLFAVLIFSTGVNVRPTAGPTTVGILGEPGVAARMFAALDRGAGVTLDLSDKWDYWPYVELPLAEVRRRLGLTS